jgi:hypothetical protein
MTNRSRTIFNGEFTPIQDTISTLAIEKKVHYDISINKVSEDNYCKATPIIERKVYERPVDRERGNNENHYTATHNNNNIFSINNLSVYRKMSDVSGLKFATDNKKSERSYGDSNEKSTVSSNEHHGDTTAPRRQLTSINMLKVPSHEIPVFRERSVERVYYDETNSKYNYSSKFKY